MSSLGASERSRRKGPQIRVTQREAELIRLAAGDVTDKQIALQLGITRDTVATYWKRLKEKFHKQTRTGLVAYLLEGEVATAELDGAGIDWSELVLGVTRSPEDPFELRATAFDRLNCGVVIEFPLGSVHYVNAHARRFVGAGPVGKSLDELISVDLLDVIRRKALRTPLDGPVRHLQLPFFAGDVKGNMWFLWEQVATDVTIPAHASTYATESLVGRDVRSVIPVWCAPRDEPRGHGLVGQTYSHAVVETTEETSATFKSLCDNFIPLLIGTPREMVPLVLRGILRSVCEAASADVSIIYSDDPELGSWQPTVSWRRDAQQRLSIEEDLRQRHYRPSNVRVAEDGERKEVVYQKHYDPIRDEWSIVCQLEYDGTYLGLWVVGGRSHSAMIEVISPCQLNHFARCIAGAVFRMNLHR